MSRAGSSARRWFVDDKACRSPAAWDVQESFSFGGWPLGVEIACDSLNVPELRSELHKRDFPILGDSFQPDYCLSFRCSTKLSLENDFCTVA